MDEKKDFLSEKPRDEDTIPNTEANIPDVMRNADEIGNQDIFSLAPLFMPPDEDEEDEETETQNRTQAGDATFAQVVRPVPTWLETLRAALGMRPIPPTTRHIFETIPDPAVEREERQRIKRLIPYVVAILAFALLCGICVWGYGRFVGPSNISRAIIINEAVQLSLGQLERGDLSSALTTIENVRQQYPGDAAVDFLNGYIARKNDQPSGEKLPGVRNSIDLAGRAVAENDTETALGHLNEALTHKPNLISIRLLRAGMLCDSGQPAMALEDADYVERRIGKNASTFSLRGAAFMALDEPDKAINEYQQGLKLMPQSIILRLRLAEALLDTGQYDAANREALKVHTRDPGNEAAKMIIGLAQDAKNQDKSALQVYRNILINSPDHVGALNNLAYLLLNEDTEEALTEAEKLALRALNLAPDTPEVIDTLALVRLRQGKTDEALKLLRRGLELKKDLPELVEHIYDALVAQGDKAAAIAHLQKYAADVSNPRMAQRAKELRNQMK